MRITKQLRNIFRSIDSHPLARKHRLKVLSNILRWQVSQKLFPGLKKVEFVGKTSLLVNKGMTGATGNVYFGLHEFEEMSFLLHFLKPADTFYDVGANVGSYTILAAGVCRASVLSFEPVPKTYNFLKGNISVNNVEELVTTFMAAVGSAKGSISFTKSFDTVNHVVVPNTNDEVDLINVPVISLDEIKTDNIPALIKIDVEGYETEVIKGMEELLQTRALKAIIIELNGSGYRYGYDENQIHVKLLKHDFLPYAYDGFHRKLILLDNHTNHNTIYVRDLASVVQKLDASSPINIFNESF